MRQDGEIEARFATVPSGDNGTTSAPRPDPVELERTRAMVPATTARGRTRCQRPKARPAQAEERLVSQSRVEAELRGEKRHGDGVAAGWTAARAAAGADADVENGPGHRKSPLGRRQQERFLFRASYPQLRPPGNTARVVACGPTAGEEENGRRVQDPSPLHIGQPRPRPANTSVSPVAVGRPSELGPEAHPRQAARSGCGSPGPSPRPRHGRGKRVSASGSATGGPADRGVANGKRPAHQRQAEPSGIFWALVGVGRGS